MSRTLQYVLASLFAILFLGGWGAQAQSGLSQKEIEVYRRYLAQHPRPEPEEKVSLRGISSPLSLELSGFYKNFRELQTVRMYVGTGVQYQRTAGEFNALLDHAIKASDLKISHWIFEGRKISFVNDVTHLRYEVTVGDERNEFINAFSDHQVVAYLGHSRYGRGPAFKDFANYFRMGTEFETIEVDTRNAYFREEPLMRATEFPPSEVALEGATYQYQYRGQKEDSSYLPADSYTKNIPGATTDLDRTLFVPGHQIVMLSSCISEAHFKPSLRSRFPNDDRLFVGTTESAGAMPAEFVALVVALVKERANSLDVLADVRQAAGNFFTTF